jgi:hypothetical protein
MNDSGRSVFSQFVADVPKTEHSEPEIVRRGPQPRIPLAHHRSAPSEQLLSWIVNFWPSPVINLRDIRRSGPNCARDPMNAITLTEALVAYGWLVPAPVHRRDMRRWRIVREPSKTPAPG